MHISRAILLLNKGQIILQKRAGELQYDMEGLVYEVQIHKNNLNCFRHQVIFIHLENDYFTTLLSAKIINDVSIIDDSLLERSRSYETEFLAKVFDHCSMKYKREFHGLK